MNRNRVETIIRDLDRAEARKQAEERAMRDELQAIIIANDERARRKSGLSPEEWAAQKASQAAERGARRAANQLARAEQAAKETAFCQSHVPAVARLENAGVVALELRVKHAGGKAVRMVQLLQEANLATAEDAANVAKGRVGKALAAALRRMHWTYRRMAYGTTWTPPMTSPPPMA